MEPFAYAPASPKVLWTVSPKVKAGLSSLRPVLPEGNLPLSLAEVLDVALSNNTQTKISWAMAREAAAKYGQSQASDFPTLSATYTIEQTKQLSPQVSTVSTPSITTPINGTSTATTAPQNPFVSLWGPQLQLAYTLWDFGQRRATSEAARHTLYFSDLTHNRTVQTVIQTVTSDFYNYLYQKKLLEANMADVKTAETTLDASEKEFKTGVKDIADVLQSKTNLIKQQIVLVTQKQTMQMAFATLLTDMGVPANLNFELIEAPDVDADDSALQAVHELVAKALANRPDLLAAQEEVKARQEELRAAQKAYFPTLTYTFNLGKTFFKNGGLSGHDNYDFDGLLSFNLPIFSGFSTRNAVRLAEANKEQAEAKLQEAELGVVKDIADAHTGVKTAFEEVKYAIDFLQSAEKQYEVALGKYKAGTTTILDVVSAQSSLADARAERAKATQNWFTSLANLAYATGVME